MDKEEEEELEARVRFLGPITTAGLAEVTRLRKVVVVVVIELGVGGVATWAWQWLDLDISQRDLQIEASYPRANNPLVTIFLEISSLRL